MYPKRLNGKFLRIKFLPKGLNTTLTSNDKTENSIRNWVIMRSISSEALINTLSGT